MLNNLKLITFYLSQFDEYEYTNIPSYFAIHIITKFLECTGCEIEVMIYEKSSYKRRNVNRTEKRMILYNVILIGQ